MLAEALEELIAKKLNATQVTVTGDGRHFDAFIVSELFVGKRLVQRQQLVYQSLGSAVTTGDIHALTMKTLTIEEWKQQRG